MTTSTDRTAPPVDQRIADALGRLRGALAERPALGRAARNTSICELGDDTLVTVRERDFTLTADIGHALGGGAAALSPSGLLRAALGTCLALGYRLHAAEAGVPLHAVRVTVESESDVRGMLDPDADAPPGFTALRYHVEIDSPAHPDDVARVVDLGDRLSPVLDLLTRPVAALRTVSHGPLAQEA